MKSKRPLSASALAAALTVLAAASPAGAAALQFNGSASVQIADSPSVSMTGPITVEAWINRAVGGVQHSIVEKYGCSGVGGYVLRVTDANKLMFGTRDDCNNGSSVVGLTSIPAGQWVHVAGSWDGATLRVFVNGVADGSLATTRNPKDGNSPLKIGERGNGGTPFNGMIDDVRLWNVAKTAAQIAAAKDACLSGNEANLAAYYKMEEGAGGTTADSTVNGNTGTLVGAAWSAAGGISCAGAPPPPPPPPPAATGVALQFNGNASVQIPDGPAVSPTGAMTVEAWIKRAASGVQHSIVEKYGCGAGGGGYVLRVTDANKVLFGTRDDCNNGSSVTGGTTIPVGVWTHVAGHWDGASLRVFVNGILDGSLATTRNPKDGVTALKIGERGNGGTPFNGLIDEVRLWNGARSAAQLVASRDTCLVGNEAGLAGYWKMDEGSGAIANDSSGNFNNGGIVNALWVAPGAPVTCAVAPPPPPPPVEVVIAGGLKNVPVPLPTNLGDFVSDRATAIRLGKALFWDMQAGGDGLQACASCHFQAGADGRDRNQLNPRASFGPFTANKQMSAADFPISNGSVMGSQGERKADFISIILGNAEDAHTPVADSIFKISTGGGDVNVRQATGRNTPPAINAVFNFRTFWDGRANNIFNGVNPAGPTDPAARVLKVLGGVPTPVSVAFTNACLASQAVGPPNNSVEMSFNGRNFLQLGKKMLNLTPLAQQHVEATDSVLGGLAAGGQGLTTTYEALIMAAFRPEYWNSTAVVDANKNVITPTGALDEFRVIEANFSLFWGLSIMLYEATLVSDDTRVDRFLDGNTAALSPLEQAGMNVFTGKGRCDHCHGLPMTTEATVADAVAHGAVPDPLVGFEIIGVRPTADDGGDILQPNQGFFKIPALRNVELNGPYFHNGGKATLRQVVEFYNNGGDFAVAGRDSQIRPLGLTEGEKQALVSFLMALTDQRVRIQSAPFDHPELRINNGHNPDGSDNVLVLPATGAAGGAPFTPFLGLNPQQP